MRLLGNDQPPLALSVKEFERAAPWIEMDDHYSTIEQYLKAAQEVIETASRRVLTPRAVAFDFELTDRLDFSCWWFPVAPVTEVSEVQVAAPFSTPATFTSDDFHLVSGLSEPRLLLSDAIRAEICKSEAGTMSVKATVGHAAPKVAPIKGLTNAMILVIKEWFDAGVSIGELSEIKGAFNAKALVKQSRYVRPKVVG